jgi:hypothetical protein
MQRKSVQVSKIENANYVDLGCVDAGLRLMVALSLSTACVLECFCVCICVYLPSLSIGQGVKIPQASFVALQLWKLMKDKKHAGGPVISLFISCCTDWYCPESGNTASVQKGRNKSYNGCSAFLRSRRSMTPVLSCICSLCLCRKAARWRHQKQLRLCLGGQKLFWRNLADH